MTTTIDRLKSQIAAHEHQLQMRPDDRQAALRMRDLQAALHQAEASKANHDREAAREAAVRADQLAKADKALQAMLRQREEAAREREERAAEQLERELRAKYESAAPGRVSDAEWSRVRSQVLHDHRMKRMETESEAVTSMRRNYRSQL